MIWGLIIGGILGLIAGALLSNEEDCPATVLGYDCQGDRCDHRKSELYRAKMHMARSREEWELRQEQANRDKQGNDE